MRITSIKHPLTAIPYSGILCVGRLRWIARVCAVATLVVVGLPVCAQTGNTVPAAPNAPAATRINPPTSPLPEARVEFFGAEQGYTVGTANVVLLCVVRNVGTIPLPNDTLRLRCYPLTGLDYTTGETRPVLPALAPNQAVAFRWQLAPAEGKGPLVAAVLVERMDTPPAAVGRMAAPFGGPKADPPSAAGIASVTDPTPLPAPRAVLTVIPRFTAVPHAASGVIPAGAAPDASATSEAAWVGNDRICARILAADGRLPALLLAGRDGKLWRELATALPLARVRSGEDGQLPWWETFRWRSARILRDKDRAALTLVGTVGTRWRAELTLETHRDTAVLSGRLRLMPLRTLRIYSVQLPRLLPEDADKNAAAKADGTAQPLASEEPLLPETARVAASRLEGITFGLTWPSEASLPGWHGTALPAGNSSLAPVLGVQWDGEERGSIVLPGAAVEFPFRLFAFGPSDTLRDALRFALP